MLALAPARFHLALDRSAGGRFFDRDGRLHIPSSVISAAVVNEYLGREILGYVALGLQPERRYALYRDPTELERAAPSFEGVPVLIEHAPIEAANHRRDLVVGVVLSPEWAPPKLLAEIIVWDGSAIALIESGDRADLSAGYRYEVDMTSGRAGGTSFDGRMLDIQANHIALVADGRVKGAVVGDAALRRRVVRRAEFYAPGLRNITIGDGNGVTNYSAT
jgi:uncharacterized protein